MADTKNLWIKKVQSSMLPNLRAPNWELVKNDTNILRCSRRTPVTTLYTLKEGCLRRNLSLICMSR